MTQRKYSVSEIDRMRAAVRDQGEMLSDGRVVEERLRTYILNGTDPVELEIANHHRRIAHWRAKLIEFGPNGMSGPNRPPGRVYYSLLELRKHIFNLEATKARNGL